MKTWNIAIKGVTSLVWNRYKKELADELSKLKKDQLKDWEEKNWKRKAEYDTEGNLLLPAEWLKQSLVAACKFSRDVPWFATSKNQTYTAYMQSTVITVNEPVGVMSDLDYYGAFVGARGKNSPTKTWRVRPLLKQWGTSFKLHDPDGRMKPEELNKILTVAGTMVGVGDNRINNYGRFTVEEVKEE